MPEKKVSVRLAAVGGKELKGEFVAIGAAGKEALTGIAANARPASDGLESIDVAASRARQAYEDLAIKASNSAASLRTAGTAATPMVDQINRLTGVTPAVGQTTAEFLQQGQALDQLRAKYNPVYAAIQRYRTVVSEVKSAHLQGAITADEMASAIQRERRASLDSIAALKGRTVAIHGMSNATRMANFRTQQMFYQVNDIGVSLAGGMNPFVVMAQQGTQIAQIYGFGNGGVGAALRDIGGMAAGLVRKFLSPVGIALGVITGAIAGVTSAINESSNATVSFGDTALAIWQTVRSGLDSLLRPAIEKISEWFSVVWDRVVEYAINAGNSIINTVKIGVLGVQTAIQAIPHHFNEAFYKAVSLVASRMHDMVFRISEAVNGVARGLNEIFGTQLSTSNFSGIIQELDEASGKTLAASAAAAKSAEAVWGDFRAEAEKLRNEDPLGNLFNDIKARAIENSLRRVEEGQKKAGAAGRRAGKEAAKGWKTAQETLAEYARDAGNRAKGMGDVMSNAFDSAESAFRRFTEGGKLDFRGLVQSMVADLAMLQFRSGVLAPIAELIAGGLGSGGGGFFGNLLGSILHDGGRVGLDGPSRQVPAMAFAGAERFHSGGWPGLKPDEVPVIAQRGERVWSRQEVARGMHEGGAGRGGNVFHIDARGAQLGVAEEIERVLDRREGRIVQKSVAAVQNAQRRGYS